MQSLSALELIARVAEKIPHLTATELGDLANALAAFYRAMKGLALAGNVTLNNAEFRTDPNFGFKVPVAVTGVDSNILDPRETWPNKAQYDETAAKLVDQFVENFAQFEEHVDEGVRQSAPVLIAA